MFVRRNTQHQLMKHKKKNLRETIINVTHDLTPLWAKKIRDLRSKDDVGGVVSSNENTFVLMEDNQTPIFHNLYKLFSNVSNDLKKRSF